MQNSPVFQLLMKELQGKQDSEFNKLKEENQRLKKLLDGSRIRKQGTEDQWDKFHNMLPAQATTKLRNYLKPEWQRGLTEIAAEG